jgi:hypothetical protein
VLVVCAAAPVNIHDSTVFPTAFAQLIETATRLTLSLKDVPLTLDPGFDSTEHTQLIRGAQMIPVIKPNLRNTKDKKIIEERTRAFELIQSTYILRHTVERGFAWEDKYRKLVIRYERLKATFDGFRYLAAAMVNYRTEFGKSL